MRALTPALISFLASPRAQSVDLVATLRDRTRGAHDQLESLPTMRRLLADDLTPAEYGLILARMAAVILPLDAWLAVHAQDPLRLARPRTPLLLGDLEALAEVPAPPAAGVPAMLARLATPAQRAGAVYVLEGSSLGGQVILRHLLARFGEPARGCAAYFDPNGVDRGRVWRDVLARLRTASGLAHAEVVDGALAVFETMHAAMRADGDGASTVAVRRGGCPFARLARLFGR